jgi:hypothetical protein
MNILLFTYNLYELVDIIIINHKQNLIFSLYQLVGRDFKFDDILHLTSPTKTASNIIIYMFVQNLCSTNYFFFFTSSDDYNQAKF